jgi:16S rRNA (guanine527-N7)-methyltransferase
VEHQQELRELILTSAASIGLILTETHIDQFMMYLQELLVWNKKINLTSIDKPRDIIVKHFLDSLAALNACNIPFKSVVVDIGSGAGFPGIPLKIVREDLQLILIEPVHKKSSYLKSLIGLLKLKHASTFDGTVQEYAKAPTITLADFVVVRALKFNEIMSPLKEILRQGGRAILYRAESINSVEIHNDFTIEKEVCFSLPYGYGNRVISVVEPRQAA